MVGVSVMSEIKRVYLSKQVLESIIKYIQDNNLQVDDRLPTEGRFAELFQVSRTSVREAIKALSINGAVGGCQGEVGVSSAIAAAGIASLFSKDPAVIFEAMGMCMKNLLGLVCDPIAGPIEVPCIKRNAVGVANAFISADMACVGITSYIPPDEVIDALKDVQRRLPMELRATTIGGLACSHTGVCLREKLKSELVDI